LGRYSIRLRESFLASDQSFTCGGGGGGVGGVGVGVGVGCGRGGGSKSNVDMHDMTAFRIRCQGCG